MKKDENHQEVDYVRTDGQINFSEPRTEDSILDITVNISMAYLAGYLSRKLIVGKSKNFTRNVLGSMVDLAIANQVYKNADYIKYLGGRVIFQLKKKIIEVK